MNKFDIEQFFPEYLDYKFEKSNEDSITLFFETNRVSFECPECNQESSKPSTMYIRTLQDKSIFDKNTMLQVKLRKYVCTNCNCHKKVFAERIDDFALPKQRQTNRLEDAIKTYGLIHAANSVARELKQTNVIVSSSTVLRHSKNYTHEICYDEVTAVAVDDFCLKKKSDTLR